MRVVTCLGAAVLWWWSGYRALVWWWTLEFDWTTNELIPGSLLACLGPLNWPICGVAALIERPPKQGSNVIHPKRTRR